MTSTETGLAFSGGGIRSAALCSGVLRRLLQNKVKVDYLSCVSGGGYTGTAFLDWKYRKGKKEDDEEWHKHFFDHMRERAGYLCNWEKPLEGIRDTIILLCLVLLNTFIEPIIIYGSYAFPVAFIIDYLFGKYLRAKLDCDVAAAQSGQSGPTLPSHPNATAQEIREHCLARQGTDGFNRILLFSILAVLYVIFYILGRKLPEKISKYFRFFSAISFLFLSFTFLPFATNDFFIKIPLWSRLLIILIATLLWFVLPLLRSKTSFVLIIYIYSYIIYWKVYEAKIVGVVYSDELFNRLLFASGFILWFVPYLDASHKRLVHIYNRWRLQKAFYSNESLVARGWLDRLHDVFCPLWTCLGRKGKQIQQTYQQADNRRDPDQRSNEPFVQDTVMEKGPLNLADLKGMEPEYISNMTVHDWKKNEHSVKDYNLLTMSPTTIERLDHQDPSIDQFHGKLGPHDVELSDAMATSAAAISDYDNSVKGLIRIYTLLGLEMGTTMISNFKSIKAESCYVKVLPSLVNIVRGLPLICVPALYYTRESAQSSIEAGVIIFFLIHLVLAFIAAFIDTGARKPNKWEKIARWFIVHVSFVRFVREALSMENCGPMPPPVMLLSDGGHVENLGILPLLKKKLSKIIVVDGGYAHDENAYGDSLLKALMLARTKLNCSFIGQGGRDVISDLLENFVKPQKPNERKPRHYKFKVEYYQDKVGKIGKGEILLIRPRDPRKGEESEVKSWSGAGGFGLDLNSSEWGNSPYLTEEDVDKLTFCCCTCCNQKSCLSSLSKMMCNTFPNHSTANQFFTPLMFSAYHREGYRACVEADAAQFIKDERDAQRQQSEFVNIDV